MGMIKKFVKGKTKKAKARFAARDVSTAELQLALKNPGKARKAGLSSQTLRAFEQELESRSFRKKQRKNNMKKRKKTTFKSTGGNTALDSRKDPFSEMDEKFNKIF